MINAIRVLPGATAQGNIYFDDQAGRLGAKFGTSDKVECKLLSAMPNQMLIVDRLVGEGHNELVVNGIYQTGIDGSYRLLSFNLPGSEYSKLTCSGPELASTTLEEILKNKIELY